MIKYLAAGVMENNGRSRSGAASSTQVEEQEVGCEPAAMRARRADAVGQPQILVIKTATLRLFCN